MMWYGYGDGWMWVLGTVMMVLFWGGIVVLAVWALRSFSGGPRGGQEGPVDILKRRLASGEITEAEYEQSRKAVQG